MTTARSHLVDEYNGGFYFCTSRCVRRSWLCGVDPLTGISYGHRKPWIERRLVTLTRTFAVDLYAFAIMSNHHHEVVYVDPARARAWSDEEVARRWTGLLAVKNETERQAAADTLLSQPKELAKMRWRLGSLSWFMKYVNEYVARWANKEDGCTGRFWQGRFGSSALLDEESVVETMAYTDLNPLRAGMTNRVSSARHTSIRRRILEELSDSDVSTLAPLERLGLTTPRYVALLEWTAATRRGAGFTPAKSALEGLHILGCRPEEWLRRVKARHIRRRAYGNLEALKRFAASLGQQRLKGMRQAT